jgi:hypothetical protein
VAAAEERRLSSLDAFLPAYEFRTRHEVRVDAPAQRIDEALREVTFGDVPIVRLLVFLRGLGRGRPDRRVVAALARRGRVLDDAPGEGIVFAIDGRFWRLRGGGDEPAARAVVDFRARDGALATETRVHVPHGESQRRFDRYWRVVRPFSGITRTQVLRAAKRRAELQR